ncbi:translocon-associated protein subunit beta-like [Anomalospiza imberbis]|uniref:translocon-associated protein subunit beta-like n=1 Tax=Anomalospiza imberbis TaxID=187417 RepID=UPI00358FF4AD
MARTKRASGSPYAPWELESRPAHTQRLRACARRASCAAPSPAGGGSGAALGRAPVRKAPEKSSRQYLWWEKGRRILTCGGFAPHTHVKEQLAPRASNVSHTVVLRPLKAGYFNFTSATITYLAQEGAQVVVGFTSAPGQGGILAQRDFDRRFSPHFLDWAAFGVMTLPSIGIPLLLWYSSKRKYDTPKSKKN